MARSFLANVIHFSNPASQSCLCDVHAMYMLINVKNLTI